VKGDQLLLPFDRPLHRERDRPPSIKPRDWSAWIDRICVRGGVRFTEQGLLEDFRKCCPQHSSVCRIDQLNLVHLSSWEGYWDRWRAWS